MSGGTHIALLVDDNPDDQELALVAFEAIGSSWQFVVAGDGVEALDYLFGVASDTGDTATARIPELVLLDLKLPKVDGLEVLRRMREVPALEDVFVAVLTSSNEEQDRSESLRLGADVFVQKALDFNEFIADLKRIDKLVFSRIRSRFERNSAV